jgi:hypothetical protein
MSATMVMTMAMLKKAMEIPRKTGTELRFLNVSPQIKASPSKVSFVTEKV